MKKGIDMIKTIKLFIWICIVILHCSTVLAIGSDIAVPSAIGTMNAFNVVVIYNMDSEGVRVQGVIPDAKNINVIISIVAESIAPAALSDNQLPAAIIQTETDRLGNFNAEILLGETASGKYICYVTSEKGSGTASFIHVDKGQANEEVENINLLTNATDITAFLTNSNTALLLGVDPVKFAAVAEKAAAYLLTSIKTRPFADVVDFDTRYSYAFACASVNVNGASALEECGESLGINYAKDFVAIQSQNQKDRLLHYLMGLDYTESIQATSLLTKVSSGARLFSEIFDEYKFLSCITTASNWGVLKSTILSSEGVDYGFSTTKYDTLPTTAKKDEVFSRMMESNITVINVVNQLEDAISIYNKAVDAVIASLNKGGGSSGGGGGSSVGGGGSSGGGGNSSVGVGPIAATSTVTLPAVIPTEYENIFNDMDDHWAKSAVAELSNVNIINGFPDGSFKPEQSITRAEFVKIALQVMQITPKKVKIFDDVQETDWYFTYVAGAYSAGIITGYGDNFFPNNNISRQDAAVVVYRALIDKLSNSSFAFSDEDKIAPYAKQSVSALAAASILRGSEDKFSPEADMTRAEAATLFKNVLDFR